MITAGIVLVQRFHRITYPFAALILFAAWRMLFAEEREQRVVERACDVCSTWIARVIPVSPVLHGHDFWRRERGRLIATPLFVALVLIETTDIVFALDSVLATWITPARYLGVGTECVSRQQNGDHHDRRSPVYERPNGVEPVLLHR